MINPFGPQGPVRYDILPAEDGRAAADVDRNGRIDDGDAFLTVGNAERSEYLDFASLRQALEARPGPVASTELARDLGADNTSVVTGTMCFDMVSTLHQKQTFERKDGQISWLLEPDPTVTSTPAPPEGVAQVSLVQDADGVLRWVFPEPPAPPPPPEGAVTEPTCVERDGVLHWLWPGEVPQPGDRIVGNPDTFMDNLGKS